MLTHAYTHTLTHTHTHTHTLSLSLSLSLMYVSVPLVHVQCKLENIFARAREHSCCMSVNLICFLAYLNYSLSFLYTMHQLSRRDSFYHLNVQYNSSWYIMCVHKFVTSYVSFVVTVLVKRQVPPAVVQGI